MNSPARGFASDNSAAIHPAVLEAIAGANVGHAFGYGHDEYSTEVAARVASLFGEDASAFFVFNGSGANVVALRACCRPWEGVICAVSSHLNVDECGAPEAVAGVKLLTVEGVDGKLTPDAVAARIVRIGDEHAVQPRVLSVSQCTELGTLYSPDELAALAELAHSRDLLLHVDGARLANAAAALGVSLPEACGPADIVSFGGTKNGLVFGEAVVVREPSLAGAVPYLRKQSLQLASKMRFLAAQFEALLGDELWRRCAANANAMAARLAGLVGEIRGVQITRPVQTNAVFAVLPRAATTALLERFAFYLWDETIGEVRWMCSWDTTEDDVNGFAAAVADVLA